MEEIKDLEDFQEMSQYSKLNMDDKEQCSNLNYCPEDHLSESEQKDFDPMFNEDHSQEQNLGNHKFPTVSQLPEQIAFQNFKKAVKFSYKKNEDVINTILILGAQKSSISNSIQGSHSVKLKNVDRIIVNLLKGSHIHKNKPEWSDSLRLQYKKNFCPNFLVTAGEFTESHSYIIKAIIVYLAQNSELISKKGKKQYKYANNIKGLYDLHQELEINVNDQKPIKKLITLIQDVNKQLD